MMPPMESTKRLTPLGQMACRLFARRSNFYSMPKPWSGCYWNARLPRRGPPMPAEQLLKVPDVSARLGISIRQVWRLIATGAIASKRVGTRSTRVPETALAQFIEKLPEAR
jgi:excisionase family DNA binding protein